MINRNHTERIHCVERLRRRRACANFPTMPSRNFYSGSGLDRAEHLRDDIEWLLSQLSQSTTRILPVWRTKNLIQLRREGQQEPQPIWLRSVETEQLIALADEMIFLGLRNGEVHVALDLSGLEDPGQHPQLKPTGEFVDLREIGPLLPRDEGSILAYARGLMHWHKTHAFCGRCGHQTRSTRAGHVRTCSNPDCGTSHFPRSDPAVIMLVHDGDRCLVGRQAMWPPGMHSVLAGFVEPGESLEEAVIREVFEEVGLKVDQVKYRSSQPWPFPSSIMLGFSARALTTAIKLDERELESARWYTREEMINSPENESFRLPRRDSIARLLIEDWLAEQNES